MNSERKLFASPSTRYVRPEHQNACDPCAPKTQVVCETTRCVEKEVNHQDVGCGNWWYLFWWFVIIAVIVWLILVLTCPEWIQQCDCDGNPNGEIDQGKAVLYAVIIAIIISVLIWLFTGAGAGFC